MDRTALRHRTRKGWRGAETESSTSSTSPSPSCLTCRSRPTTSLSPPQRSSGWRNTSQTRLAQTPLSGGTSLSQSRTSVPFPPPLLFASTSGRRTSVDRGTTSSSPLASWSSPFGSGRLSSPLSSPHPRTLASGVETPSSLLATRLFPKGLDLFVFPSSLPPPSPRNQSPSLSSSPRRLRLDLPLLASLGTASSSAPTGRGPFPIPSVQTQT